jgi:hypothetical protein
LIPEESLYYLAYVVFLQRQFATDLKTWKGPSVLGMGVFSSHHWLKVDGTIIDHNPLKKHFPYISRQRPLADGLSKGPICTFRRILRHCGKPWNHYFYSGLEVRPPFAMHGSPFIKKGAPCTASVLFCYRVDHLLRVHVD